MEKNSRKKQYGERPIWFGDGSTSNGLRDEEKTSIRMFRWILDEEKSVLISSHGYAKHTYNICVRKIEQQQKKKTTATTTARIMYTQFDGKTWRGWVRFDQHNIKSNAVELQPKCYYK